MSESHAGSGGDTAWQGAFYNLCVKLAATGGLVAFAGWLYEGFSTRGPHRSTLMSVRGRSFCCSCASRSSLWAFTISARFLQAVRLEGRSLRDGLRPERGLSRRLHQTAFSNYIAFIILGTGWARVSGDSDGSAVLKADTASGAWVYEPADRPLLRDFRRGGVSHRLAFGGLLHRLTRFMAQFFHPYAIFDIPSIRGLCAAGMAAASRWLVGGGIVGSTSATASASWAPRCL